MPRKRANCSKRGCKNTYETFKSRKTTLCKDCRPAWQGEARWKQATLGVYTLPDHVIITMDKPRTMPPARQDGLKIMVIPDTQVGPGTPTEHLSWIAKYAVEKRPDVIVHLGDHWDMPSLSSYDEGKKSFEGRRYQADIDAGLNGMSLLLSPIVMTANWSPRLIFTLGNHEDRISRMVEKDARLEGTVGLKDLRLEAMGWEVYPFLKPVDVAGIEFAHYFTSGVMGRPATSASALVNGKYARPGSSVMGHVQTFDYAVHRVTQRFAIWAGCAYLHDEDYLGPQGNVMAKRQVVMLHEARESLADPMFVSLGYLEKKYRSRGCLE